MATKRRAVMNAISSVILLFAGMLLLANIASGSTPATFDSGTISCSTDKNGYCTGPTLAFRPSSVTITIQSAGGPSQAKPQITSNGFRARFFQPTGATATTTTLTYSYVATSGTTSTPTPTATAPVPNPTPSDTPIAAPSRILNLNNWYLTLPVGSPAATMVQQPKLDTYSSSYFFSNAAGNGVVFHAPVSGSTTTGSIHTRSELRETAPNGTLPWGWSAGSGTHTLTATEAITHLPGGNGTLGFAQIHGPGSTWYLILDAVGTGNGTAKLVLKDSTGKATGAVIASGYKLGTKFNLTMSATNGEVGIDYNGIRKVTTQSTEADSYFKIGAYNQSDGDFGEAVVYNLSATHR